MEKPLPRKKPREGEDGRTCVREVQVPTRPECAGRGTEDTTVIRVLQSGRRTNANLYIEVKYFDWLLQYAADEHHFQGVAPVDDGPAVAASKQGNCPAVEDLHVEWQFEAKAWDATFVAGTLKDTKKRVSLDDLNTNTWEALRAAHKVRDSLGKATLVEKMQRSACSSCGAKPSRAMKATNSRRIGEP